MLAGLLSGLSAANDSLAERDLRAKAPQFVDFAAVIEPLHDKISAARAHAICLSRIVEQPADGSRELDGALRWHQQTRVLISKEGTNRRQIARDHGQAAGPVFKDLYGNIEK